VTAKAKKSCCCRTPESGQAVRETVRAAYAKIATGGGPCCGPKPREPGCGCGSRRPEALARRLGYSEGDLAALPEGANLGLSCGNPAAVAALRPGETVLDLGSGGGLDVFVCAGKVGPKGRAIGVDMTPEMLGRARRNAAAFTARTGLANAEFRLGEIEHLPVADATVDAVISNCVINLSPDKDQVFRESFRVLRKGGRLMVSDIVSRGELPESVRNDAAMYAGCIAGALPRETYLEKIRAAGFRAVEVVSEHVGEKAGVRESAEIAGALLSVNVLAVK
jgi:arsenite methyltransferase